MRESVTGIRLRHVLAILTILVICSSGLYGQTEPKTLQEYVAQGRELLAEGNAVEAVEVLLQATELFPDSQGAHYFLAGAWWAAGEPDSSMQSTLRRKELSAETALQELLAERGDSLADTAEEVIDLHLAAIGGRDAVAEIKTMVVDFTANSTAGSVATIRRQYKRPFKYRQEVVGNSGFVATDGELTWRVKEGVWQEIDETSYLHMASIDGHFLDYGDAGVHYEFIGVEIFSDTPVYRLERIFRDGVQQDLFFSIETGLLTEIRSEYPAGNPVMISAMSLWDYRDVGGIHIPHVFIRNVGPLGTPHGGVVQEVRVNVPLDDSLFVKQ